MGVLRDAGTGEVCSPGAVNHWWDILKHLCSEARHGANVDLGAFTRLHYYPQLAGSGLRSISPSQTTGSCRSPRGRTAEPSPWENGLTVR